VNPFGGRRALVAMTNTNGDVFEFPLRAA